MVVKSKKVYLMVCGQVFDGKQRDWLKNMPELGIIANVEPVFVFEKNSADITPEIWIKLAEEINSRIDEASGFVVLHGIDNILYTASVLSFLLQNLIRPIVFTGGQLKPVGNKKIDIRANIINAAQAASFEFSEIGLMFGNRLLRANQASRSSDDSLNIFVTPPSGILGRIDFSIRIFDKVVHKNKGKTKLYSELNNNIEIVKVGPTLSLKDLAKRLADRDGVIVKAGKYESLPADLMFLLEKVTKDTPVVIWSKVLEHSVMAPKNFLLVNNMTWEATLTKFMWVLAQTNSLKKVKELMSQDLAGEILEWT